MEFIFTSAPDIAWTKVSFEKSDEEDMLNKAIALSLEEETGVNNAKGEN